MQDVANDEADKAEADQSDVPDDCVLAVGSDTVIQNREGRLRLLLLQRFPVEVQNVLKFIRRQLLWYAKCEVIEIFCVFTEGRRPNVIH